MKKSFWLLELGEKVFLESDSWAQLSDSKNTFSPNSSDQNVFFKKVGGIYFFSSTCGQNMSLYGQILLPKQWL